MIDDVFVVLVFVVVVFVSVVVVFVVVVFVLIFVTPYVPDSDVISMTTDQDSKVRLIDGNCFIFVAVVSVVSKPDGWALWDVNAVSSPFTIIVCNFEIYCKCFPLRSPQLFPPLSLPLCPYPTHSFPPQRAFRLGSGVSSCLRSFLRDSSVDDAG